jgi:hypothetical protein
VCHVYLDLRKISEIKTFSYIIGHEVRGETFSLEKDRPEYQKIENFFADFENVSTSR